MKFDFDFDEIQNQLKVSTNRMEQSFDEQYPDAMELDDIYYNGSMLIKDKEQHPCWNCNKPTYWIDVNFEAHLCSPSCEDAKWAEYENA